jgi:GT2 family glycosyltransferase
MVPLAELIASPGVFAAAKLTGRASRLAHIPFASWCIEVLRPAVVVDLGAHLGDGYRALCETVESLGLSTTCAPASGDEAASGFRAGTIDLLLLDGSRADDDLRQDFATWLPKLSDSAVVLFPSINGGEAGSVPRRSWRELSARYPHFASPHGGGLGILVVGATAPPAARRLAACTTEEAEQVRSFFARLGGGIAEPEPPPSGSRSDELRDELEECRTRANELQQRLARAEEVLAACRATKVSLRSELAERAKADARLRSGSAAGRLFSRVREHAVGLVSGISPRKRREARIVAESGMFDAAWYLEQNPDVAAKRLDPLRHYLSFGVREGRDPNPAFDTNAFLYHHPDVAASGVNPLAHCILNGTVGGEIALPRHEQPLVSIVVPVHRKAAVTHRCLATIARDPSRAPYEVIVVDDDSRDETAAVLARVRNLRVVTNATNLGYLRSCNEGVRLAQGRYVVMLNNDTEVEPGWLDALVDLAEADPEVGVVGAKLVYPDGTLQEAGGIIWSDGDGWNYGRNDDPERDEYNFVREVDFCSGACLLVRTDLLRRLGGYDERFAPAYYEDVDLCFAARAAGYRVLYQPQARVVHHEGVSHGTDVTTGTKSYQTVNRQAFSEKWAGELARQSVSGPDKVRRARDRRQGPGILVIDYMVPTPDRDAGSLRMSLLLRALANLGCRVRFLPQNGFRLEPYAGRLGQFGVEVLSSSGNAKKVLPGLAGDVDLTIISRPAVAVNLMPLVREHLPESQVVYDMVDFHGLRESRRSETCAQTAVKGVAVTYRELELALIRAADATIAVTEHERDLVLAEVPTACVHVVPTIHESPRSKAGFAAREGLLFVGSYQHTPNEDAVLYFHEQILPLIRRRLPQVVLHLVGQPVPPGIRALASPLVCVHGWVEDLAELHERCRVFVAPLRYGAGMKGKIGDSLIRGVPVVTTSVGAEGMQLIDGTDVLVADTPAAFADAVVRLYTDRALWENLVENGSRRVVELYGAEAATRRIAALLEEHGLAGRLSGGKRLRRSNTLTR